MTESLSSQRGSNNYEYLYSSWQRTSFERQRLQELPGGSHRTESSARLSHTRERKGSKYQSEYRRGGRHNKVDFWKCYNLHSYNLQYSHKTQEMSTKTDHLSGSRENDVEFNGVGRLQRTFSHQNAMKVEGTKEIKKKNTFLSKI